MLWKATTLAFACSTVWLGWPTDDAAQNAQRFPEQRERIEVDETHESPVSAEIDAMTAMRGGEVELAERLLNDPRPRVSRAAVETLLRAGASDALADAISDEIPIWRLRRVVGALGWIGDRTAVHALSALLDEEFLRIHRYEVADALGTTANPAALPALRRYVEKSVYFHDGLHRGLAAVAYLATPEADQQLIDWARRSDHIGTAALARLDPLCAECLELLREALASPDTTRATSAAQALASSGELHDELFECARERRDDARMVCVDVLSQRADPALAELMSDSDLIYAALQIGDTEAGRAVLRQMAARGETEPRAYALLGLALSDEDAATELVALSAEFAVSDRIEIAEELFERRRPEAAVEIIVDAVTSGTNQTVRENALRALLWDQTGEDALRGLARSGDDAVAEHAARVLLSRGTLTDNDADLLDDALANGHVSILNRVQQMGPQVQRRVIGYIDDPDTRGAAMRALARSMPAAEALRLAGGDPELQAIVMSQSRDANDTMMQIGRRVVDEEGLQQLATQFYGHPVTQELMHEALASSDPSERRLALAHVGSSASTNTLEELARDRDESVRGQAMRHLLDRPGGASIRAAFAGVRDSDPEIRELAVQTLAHTPDRNARQAVLDALHDPEVEVAEQAAASVLNTIGGEAFDEVVAVALSSHAHRGRLAHLILESDYALDESTRANLESIAETAAPRPPRVIVLDEI